MRAAILTGPGTLEYVDDLDVEQPAPGEVSVQVRWCGVCHSDLHVVDAVTPGAVPSVLGHEAAGVIVSVGAGVDDLAPGDHVVLSMIGPCGQCENCLAGAPVSCLRAVGRGGVAADGSTRISRHGEQVLRGIRVGGFAERAVAKQEAVVKIPDDMPLDLACLLGCAIQTGYGAVVNVARVAPGSGVAVIGLGAVGIAAIQSAVIAGATTVVGIDPLPGRRDLALKLGATHVFSPEEATPDAIREAAGTLLDVVLDTVSKPVTVRSGIQLVGPRGTVVVIGVTPPGAELGVATSDVVMLQKRIVGCYLGNCIPNRDIPELVKLWQRGRLDLESMVTARRPLDELDAAFEDLRQGVGLRTAIEVSPAGEGVPDAGNR